MSSETLEWLNTNVLCGQTEKHGKPWHYCEDHQPDESTLYPRFIPAEDVTRRLFNFTVERRPAYIPFERTIDGVPTPGFVEVPNRYFVTRTDNNQVYYSCTEKYEVHQYADWLIDQLARILGRQGHELGITSAMLLEEGGVANVTIELPDAVDSSIDNLRTFLSVFTSHNARFKTTYMVGTTRPICDNTLAAARQTATAMRKFRHVTSTSRAADDRTQLVDALGILTDAAAEEAKRLDILAHTPVTDSQWERIIEKVWTKPSENADQRAVTRWSNQATQVSDLFYNDPRVAPWKNTAWGAWQAFNTFDQHYRTIRGGDGDPADRWGRNQLQFMEGETAKKDKLVLTRIGEVTHANVPVPA